MTRRELERKLAEHFEPNPQPDPTWKGSLDEYDGGPSIKGLWHYEHGYRPFQSGWHYNEVASNGNAMIALIGTANASGMRVDINCMPKMNAAVCSPNNDLSGFATFAPTPMMAVAIAVGRSVGVLGKDEDVTDD